MKKRILIRYYLDKIVIPLSSVEFFDTISTMIRIYMIFIFCNYICNQQSNAYAGIHMGERDIHKYVSYNGGINIFS